MSDPQRLTTLTTQLLDTPIGEFRHSLAAGEPLPYRYTYLSDLSDAHSAALNMPVAERDYATPDLPPPFEQSLPEMNLALFPTAVWKFVERDRMGLLWASSRRRIGRLRFHSSTLETDRAQPAAVHVSLSDLQSAKNGDELFRDTLAALQDIPGIAGVQPKALVTLDDGPASRTVSTETHILKANHANFPGATVVESLCLAAAEAAGLPVPERVLSGDGQLLAIRRFDLTADGTPRGFDEMGALLGRNAERKYSGTLEELAQATRDYAGNATRGESLMRLFSLSVLNNAVRNGDAHLKNFGLTYDDPSAASLSPVYDVLTTRCFERLRFDAPALSLARRRKWDDYSALKAWGRTSCGLSNGEMRASFEAVGGAMEKVLPQILEARERYAVFGGELWVMRAEWLEGLEALQRKLHPK